jgi:hypothetical protein
VTWASVERGGVTWNSFGEIPHEKSWVEIELTILEVCLAVVVAARAGQESQYDGKAHRGWFNCRPVGDIEVILDTQELEPTPQWEETIDAIRCLPSRPAMATRRKAFIHLVLMG